MKNPHDKFFKETLTRRENAVSFFREYLPPEIVSRLDWRTLKIAKGSFVDPELRERFSDIVYEIRAKGRLLLIYLLMEHQSTVDPWMPLRFLHYMTELWELWRKQNPKADKLPGIIPVLFYHGEDEWDVSVHFRDILEEPGLTGEFVPRFRYLLRDFSSSGDDEIKGTVMLRLFLTVMGRIFSPGLADELERIMPLFAELSEKKTGMQYLDTVLRYIYHACDTVTPEDVETKLLQALDEDKKGVLMTIAEQLRAEGEIKGRTEGEIKGKIELYQELVGSGLISRGMAEQKVADLMRKLEEVTKAADKKVPGKPLIH